MLFLQCDGSQATIDNIMSETCRYMCGGHCTDHYGSVLNMSDAHCTGCSNQEVTSSC